MVPLLVEWFKTRDTAGEDFLTDWLRFETPERPSGSWIADAFQIELGYRFLPLLLSLRVCGITRRLTDGVPISDHVPSLLPGMIHIFEQAGVIENGRVNELGARVFERGPGPFGIIAAYHEYLNNLESLLKLDSPEVHVQRSANVAASQDANRKTFEEANDQLDAFCKEYGFKYSVFIEHAVGRGEATRQRLSRSGETEIRYFGADLEDAAIDQAIEQQKQGALPQNMEFIRSADIGQPERVIRFLNERGLSGKPAVMMVGNGFHEIRQQTNARMIEVFRAYCEAGFVLIFTEESALANDDLLHTGWNTYHAGFRYVHELSGQGLRPAIDRARLSGRWSWRHCALEAGYLVLDKFSYKSRTIYPYKKAARENPSISETYFCVPLELADKLRLPSPNSDERPAGINVDTVVLHATVLDTLSEVIRHFANPKSRVSAHYTIDRDGTVVTHVPDDRRAWHAGKSKMEDGREAVNDFSIGIELVNRNDGHDPFPLAQIDALRTLLRQIAARYPIRHVVMHYECADPPGRKSDPAGFDRAWIQDVLNEIASFG
jgi:N-acetylmuramoyl-L-alanine amidase/AmpD protein